MPLKSVVTALAGAAILAGSAGALLSTNFLASSSMNDVTAGAAGLIAGAVLVAGGVIALAILYANAGDPQRP